jgi:hypothetical protein
VVYLAMERLKTRLTGGTASRQAEVALPEAPEPSQHPAE